LKNNHHSLQHGSISILTLIILPISISLTVMVLFIGQITKQRMDLDRAIDDATLAGAMELDQTNTSFTRSINIIDTVLQHSHLNSPIDLSQVRISFGHCPHLSSTLDGVINQQQLNCTFVPATIAVTNPQGLIYVAVDSGNQQGSIILSILDNSLSLHPGTLIHSLAVAGWISPFSSRLTQ
jgi:hypothetical protein